MKKRFILALLFVFISLCSFVVAADSTPNLQDATNTILVKQFNVPENLQIPARFFFSLAPGVDVSLQNFTVLIVLWIIIFLIVREALTFSSFFGSGWKPLLVAFIITCLISVSGGIRDAANYITSAIPHSAVYMVIAIIVLAFLTAIILFVLKKVKRSTAILEDEQAGINVGIRK